MNPLELFPGKKTYILSIGAVLTALGMWTTGDMALGDMVEKVWMAVGAMTLRKGIG